jgi:hypothetical protein
VLRHLDSRLLNPLRNSFATGEEYCTEHHIRGQQILSGASHRLNGHHLRRFAPDAIASSQGRGPAINFLVRDGLHGYDRPAKFEGTMFEVEIYARGLREMGNILELDRQLVEIAGLRYKVDTNHDIVYLEFDEPTLSIRDIRTIFLKLGLEPLIIGAIPSELHSRTKTERLAT